MYDVECYLESEDEVAELRRIVAMLPQWAERAQEERLRRASKKLKEAESK